LEKKCVTGKNVVWKSRISENQQTANSVRRIVFERTSKSPHPSSSIQRRCAGLVLLASPSPSLAVEGAAAYSIPAKAGGIAIGSVRGLWRGGVFGPGTLSHRLTVAVAGVARYSTGEERLESIAKRNASDFID